MSIKSALFVSAALSLPFMSSFAYAATSSGKILIILSSENQLQLKDGKTYQTGYYLNEVIVPAQQLKSAGYELVFADPRGNTPPVDPGSINTSYFGGNQKTLDDALHFKNKQKSLTHPITLKQAIDGGLSQYKAVFIPGGPAPMIDLMASAEVGSILNYFHQHQMTTVLLCHGTAALAATTKDPVAYQHALQTGNLDSARQLSSDWTYEGYRMTVFSNEEESIAATNAFKGEPRFYPEQVLTVAGAKVQTVAAWHSLVVEDRELITGQNPFSDNDLVKRLLKRLASSNKG